MPPQIALLICILFIIYLFWTDRKKDYGHSKALWVPYLWMFLAGSRYVSSWLEVRLPTMRRGVAAYTEGSPLDATVFFMLIAAGVVILVRRKIDWGQWLTQNIWIWVYFLFCFISLTWSDYPFVAFKRWIKELGNLVMVLVILTEKRPYEAVGVILRRLAFLMLPLSILFIKYYPDMGRAYHISGAPMFTGVGHQKNDLGTICMMSGIYFLWNFLLKPKEELKLGGRYHITDLLLVGMIAYLLQKADSATSLFCLVVAVGLLLVSSTTLIARNPGRIIILLVTVISFFLFFETTLDLKNVVFRMLGRDPTLTARVPIWELLREMVTNPIVGAGYQSFWLGERMWKIWIELEAPINQAHNGYLEQYLNLGYIGVSFIIVILLSGFLKVRRQLGVDYRAAMLRLCFIVTAVLYNYTEASFYGINNIWLLTLVGVVEIQAQQGASGEVKD